MKKLIIAFIIWSFLINRSYGQEGFKVHQWDCTTGSIAYFTNLQKFLTKWNIIVTKDVYKKAIENLTQYCNLEKWVPETPSFINQLTDVAFRKIDAIKWMAYWFKKEQLDQKWLEWRKELNLFFNPKNKNKDPKVIINDFKKYRWTAKQNMKANNNTLYWKYLLACNEMSSMYRFLLPADMNNDDNYLKDLFLDTCQQMAKERYMREWTLVQKITFINFYTDVNKKLFESFSKHTKWQTSFSDKLMKLYDKFTVSLWDFQYLVLRFVKVLDANTR